MKKSFIKILIFIGALFIGINTIFAEGESFLANLSSGGFAGVTGLSENAANIKEISFIDLQTDTFTEPDGVTPVDLSYSSNNSVLGYLVEEQTGSYHLYITFNNSLKLYSNSRRLFRNLVGLETINGISKLDTSAVTNMTDMFNGCTKLKSLNLSSFNTSNVANMSGMFSGCNALMNLDVSNFNTANVTDMSSMFRYCTAIRNINLSSFNTEKVTDMSFMFSNCNNVESINLSSFRTPLLTAMRNMFESNTMLTDLRMDNFNPSGVSNFNNVFADCASIITLDLKSFEWTSASTASKMFYGCNNLETIYVKSGTDLSQLNGTGSKSMFEGSIHIKGEQGTEYDEEPYNDPNKIDIAYAKVDGGTESPGYFSSRVKISDLDITYGHEQYYTGSPIVPNVSVKHGNTTLTVDDYSITFDNNVEIGENTAHFKITGKGNYIGEIDKYFSIIPGDIANATASAIPNQTYTGNPITPSVTITYYGKTLVKDTDYTLEYSSNVETGTAHITATGIGKLGGSLPIQFNIVGKSLATATVDPVDDQAYTGSAITPNVVVKMDGETLVKNTDYELEYSGNINVGTATITINGIGNYSGQTSVTFRILSNINNATIAAIPDQTYTGNQIKPTLTVTHNDYTLVLNEDYTVTYDNKNVNVGTSTVTIHGIGNYYTGTKTATFNIVQANISGSTVTGNPQEYTGQAVTSTATVKFNNKTLVEGTDYTLEFSNNVNVGNATLVVKGKGNFKGTKNSTFEITPANISKCSVEEVATQKYTGSEIKPKVVAKFNNETLVEGTDYTLSYSNNIYTGNANIILTGKGRFKNTKIVTFKIIGADISEATVDAVANQTFNGKPITPLVKVTYKGKVLVKDTDYALNYSNNKDVGTATIIISGKGSFSEEKTTTFKIVASNMDKVTIDRINDQLYTGEKVTPKVSVKYDGTLLTESIDYTLEYSNNIEPGVATVKVIGKNNITGSKTATFNIKGRDLSNMVIDKLPVQVYTGKEIKPEVVVRFEDVILVEGTDYKLTFTNNVKVGTANIKATGINQYSGTISGTFEIKYGIKYELNGGNNDARNLNYYNNKVATKLYNPNKVGYLFKGWYTTNKYETKITEIKKGSTGNKTVYAKWTPIKYYIKFNKNGGKGSTKDMTLKYDKTYTLNKNKYTKKGYKFLGWNTSKDGNGTAYTNEQQVKNLLNVNKASITLYAQWSKRKYTITYNLNGGTLATENRTTYEVNTKTFKLNKPTKVGYVFKGWYKNKNFKGAKVTKIKKGSAGNLTLYAKFEPIKYKIIFYKNGGRGYVRDILSAKYNKTYTLTKNSYTRKGYKFTGWNTKADGSGISFANEQKVKNLTTKKNKKIKLYAQWKLVNYKITYELNGGTNNELNPSTYTVNTKTITLAKPTREGYKFKGWYSDAKFTRRVKTIDKGSTGKKVLYAKWEKIPVVAEN